MKLSPNTNPTPLAPMKSYPSVPADYPSGITNPGPKYTAPTGAAYVPKALDRAFVPAPAPFAEPPVKQPLDLLPPPKQPLNLQPAPQPLKPLPSTGSVPLPELQPKPASIPTGGSRVSPPSPIPATNPGGLPRGTGTAIGVGGAAVGAGIAIASGAPIGGALGGAAGSVAGQIGGAQLGAAIGTAIAPGVGTVIGGAIGAVAGAIAGGVIGAGVGNAIMPASTNPSMQGGASTPFIPMPQGLNVAQNYTLFYYWTQKNAGYSTGPWSYGTGSPAQLPALFAGLAASLGTSYTLDSVYLSPAAPIIGNPPNTIPLPLPSANPASSAPSGISLPKDSNGDPIGASSPAPQKQAEPAPQGQPQATPQPAPQPNFMPLPLPIPMPAPAATPTASPAPSPGFAPAASPLPSPMATPTAVSGTSGNSHTPTPVKSTPQITTPFGSTAPFGSNAPASSPSPSGSPTPLNTGNSPQAGPDGKSTTGTTTGTSTGTSTQTQTTPGRNGDCCPMPELESDLIKKIADTVGVGKFPSSLPLLAGEATENINNLPELTIWAVKCLDSVVGLFPAEIEIIAADSSKKSVKLESIAHALEELFAALVVVAEDADAAVNIGARSAIESVQAKISARQAGETATAIAKFLGFAGQGKKREVKIGFTPSAAGLNGKLENQEMQDFLKPSTQGYIGYECVENDELLPIIKRILQDAEIARAALFHPLKPNPKNADEQGVTGDYLRQSKKPKKGQKTAEDKAWESFKEQLKKDEFEVDDTPKTNNKP